MLYQNNLLFHFYQKFQLIIVFFIQKVPVIIIGNKRDMLDEIQSQDKIPEKNRVTL